MRRVVLTFGLIAAAIFAIAMPLNMKFVTKVGMDNGEFVGYTMMIAAFLMVFFGIRSYRDGVAGGAVSFGRAFQVGILITLIASAGYVATWEVLYFKFMPDFAERYGESVIKKARGSGATQAQLDKQVADMKAFAENYKKPLVNVAYTFIEVFPVGLVITLVSAGILRRRDVLATRVAGARDSATVSSGFMEK